MKLTKISNPPNSYIVTFESEQEKALLDSFNADDSMKANEVMELLGISRQTLCHYVKRGLITVDSNYTGKQYRYNRKSVMDLMGRK